MQQFGGSGEIRTHERDKPLLVFKTSAISRALPRFLLILVENQGFEPRMPEATDLQSAEVTNASRSPHCGTRYGNRTRLSSVKG